MRIYGWWVESWAKKMNGQLCGEIPGVGTVITVQFLEPVVVTTVDEGLEFTVMILWLY